MATAMKLFKYMARMACMLAGAAMLLAGCAGWLAPPKEEPVHIVLWSDFIGEQKKSLDSLVEEFNTTVGREEGITVEAICKLDSKELGRQLFASVHGEPDSAPVPHLALTYPDVAYELARQDKLVDFREYVAQGVLAEFVPDFLREGNLLGDGRLFLLPAANSTELLMINQTAFDSFCEAIRTDERYPTISMNNFATWEGILQAAEAYYQWTEEENPAPQGGGRALFGVDFAVNYLYTGSRQLGSDLIFRVRDRGVVDFSTPAFRQVWDTYYIPMIKGYFAAYGRFRSDDFRTGEILAYLGSSGSAVYLVSEMADQNGKEIPIAITTLPAPVFQEGKPVAVQQGAGFAVFASTQREEQASVQFATWFSEVERNMAFAKASSYLPVRTEAMRRLISAGADTGSPVEAALQTAATQLNSGYEVYIPPVFEGAYFLRSVLEEHLHSTTEQARANVLLEVTSGASYDYVVTKYAADDLLEQYVQDCANDLVGKDILLRYPGDNAAQE